ncbi:MAG: sodium/solute symporter [Planctomycetota bacterium]
MRSLIAILFAGLLAAAAVSQESAASRSQLSWGELPPLPDTPGYGGPFVGVHEGVLLVAGGANFPAAPPWEGGAKVWYDGIYALLPDAGGWLNAGTLPAVRAYGAALSTPEGIALVGGSDGERAHADCWLLTWDSGDGTARSVELPPLPRPTAFPAAAAAASVVYCAAGSTGQELTHAFWRLDLAAPAPERRWTELPPWPGPARHKAVASIQGGRGRGPEFYLFSGSIPGVDVEGSATYDYRTDAYRFDSAAESWERLADLPHPVAAASAVAVGQSQILVFSGSTGEHVLDPDPRPEFPRRVLAYHTITDTWTEVGSMPQAVVTTGAARWKDRLVIASGEVRPGVRTPAVRTVDMLPPAIGIGGWSLAVLALYLVALVGIGFLFKRRESTTADFFLAGKRIPWWAAGLSIFATQLSAITFVSTPALAYATDWLVLPGKAMILVMAPIVVTLYLPFFRRLEITTAYEYLERRFSPAVRLFGSASFIAFQLVRMAVVIFLPALALSTITGISVHACILIMGALSTLYTAVGGMEAVIWTDVLQTVVLVGGMIVAVFIVAADVGGFGAIAAAAEAGGKTRMWNPSLSATELTSWSLLLGTLALQFGPYTTDQAVIQRYLTTRDEKAAARGIWLNGLIAIPVGLLFMVLGTALYAFFQRRPDLLTLGMQNDEVLPLFVSGQLPAGLSGLVIAGIFAASMSSLDSSMHSIATTATVDWYQRFRPRATDASSLRVARGLTIALGVVAVVTASALATFDIENLWLFFQSCLGLVSSGVVGVFILGIFTRRAHATGALVGAAASVAALVHVTFFSPLHFYLYAVIGITTCVTVGYGASLVIPNREGRDLRGLTRVRV